MMRRRIAITSATVAVLGFLLIPAAVTEHVRRENPRTYIEYMPQTSSLTPRLTIPTEDPWIVDEYPYRGLTEPRKDRP